MNLTHEYLPLSDLPRILAPVVQRLKEQQPDAPPYKLKDWHEHDGYVTQPEESSWQELQSMLLSDQAILAASTGDTYVRTAFFPFDRSFYLRIYIPDQCDLSFDLSRDCQEPMGRFDLTCSEALGKKVQEAARRAGSVDLAKGAAKLYFDRGYAG